MPSFLTIIIIIVVLIALFSYILSFKIFKLTTLGRRKSEEDCFKKLEDDYDYIREEYEKLSKEYVEIKSSDGLILKGKYLELFKESNKVAILVHGYTDTFVTCLKYVYLFEKEGYNVLMVNQRSHGDSEGTYATYGYYEKFDLNLWVDWVRKRIGEDCCIGLFGQSMGGGTVLQYAEINKYAKFIIADCPYSDVKQLLKYQIQGCYHAPMYPAFNFTNLKMMRKAKFSLRKVSPINAIRNADVPILFIHGASDTFVPTQMSKDMYKAKKGYKKLLIVEGAEHTKAIQLDRAAYEKSVHEFIQEVENYEIK